MASIKYFIKSGTNKIYVSVSTGRKENGGFQLRKSINRELVNSKNWNNKKETVKIKPEEPNAQKINTYIQIHKSRILKRAGEIEDKDENILLSKKDYEDIINTIDGSYHFEKETKKFNFTELLDDFYNLAKTKQIFKFSVKKHFSESYCKGLKTLLHKVADFERTNYKLTLTNINGDFQDDFINHLIEDYEESYINKLVKQFKYFVNKWLIGTLNLKLPNYNPEMWSRLEHNESLKTYLTIPQLYKMLELDLSDKPEEWSVIRELYCFNALTCGMRIQDLMKLTKDNIHTELVGGVKRTVLKFRQGKTGDVVNTPVPFSCEPILKKYNGIPKNVNSVISNEVLKKLGKMCGFDSMITTKDGEKREKQYKLLTNHSARRSYCTNAWNMEMDLLTIMANSGHKSPDVLLNYIDKTLDEMVEKTVDTKYFKFVDKLDESLKLKAV